MDIDEMGGAESAFTGLTFLNSPTIMQDFGSKAFGDKHDVSTSLVNTGTLTKTRFAQQNHQSRRMTLFESVAASLEAASARGREERFEKSVMAAQQMLGAVLPPAAQRRISALGMSMSMSMSARRDKRPNRNNRKSMASFDSLDLSMTTTTPSVLLAQASAAIPVVAVEGVVQRAAAKMMEKVLFTRAELLLKKQKDEEAADRRKFLENIRRNQRKCMWLSILKSIQFALRSRVSVGQLRKKEAVQSTFRPMFILLMRRLCRKIKLRSLMPIATPPTLAQIRFDKLLALFSDSHLMHFISNMKPRYYFANEAIVFKDCQDDEAFFLQLGSADVMSGYTKVFTLKPGMTFGSMGMISGEPRSATIIAREPCLAWVGSRKVFESYGVNDHLAETGHVFITELRQKNMRQVYESTIHPDFLVKFPLLRTFSAETLSYLTAEGDARAFKPQEVLVGMSRPPPMSQRGIFVLRGRMQIVVRRDRLPQDGNLQAAFAEDAAWIVDLPRRTDQINFFQSPILLEEPRELKGMFAVADFVGPCLLCLPSVVHSEWKVMGVVGATATDVLMIQRDRFFGLDLVALADLRQSSLNIHCRFMKPPPADELQKIFFSTNISFDFLRFVKFGKLPLVPWVFSPGDTLYFDEEHGHELFLIMGGNIDHTEVSTPMLWPETTIAYFGCSSVSATCFSRVEVFRFKRANFIALFDALSPERLEVFGLALAELFASKYNRRPLFCESTLSGIISKRSRYALKRLQSLKMPQKQNSPPEAHSPHARRKSMKPGGVTFDDVAVEVVVEHVPKLTIPAIVSPPARETRPATAGSASSPVRPKSSGTSRAVNGSPPKSPKKAPEVRTPKPPVPRFPHAVHEVEAPKAVSRPSSGRQPAQLKPSLDQQPAPAHYTATVHHLAIRRTVAERKVHNELKKVEKDPIELLGALPQFYVNRLRRLEDFMNRDK